MPTCDVFFSLLAQHLASLPEWLAAIVLFLAALARPLLQALGVCG